MKILFFVLSYLLFSSILLSQNAVTFEVEDLEPPKNLMKEYSRNNIMSTWNESIERTSPLPNSFVYLGEHPILSGYVQAYREHRPITITPDMIWLLISQGFAQHVNNNSELLRKQFVQFEGKKILIVIANDVILGDWNSNWEGVFPQFEKQIADYTGEKLTKTLTADFSTTIPTTRIVNQITTMDAMKSYFDYVVALSGCGISKVTITGTDEDWKKIRQKTKELAQYQLGWWTDELDPILEEIINARNGDVKKKFWRNMVRIHTSKKYGIPDKIDGWLIKFFPYNKKGIKSDFKTISVIDDFPSEMAKVPFVYIDENTKKSYNMEFWAGFVGLSQNKEDFTIQPEIAWVVINQKQIEYRKLGENQHNVSVERIKGFPKEILGLESIEILHLDFEDAINIPEALAKIKIDKLEIEGSTNPIEIKRILSLFPQTTISINGVTEQFYLKK